MNSVADNVEGESGGVIFPRDPAHLQTLHILYDTIRSSDGWIRQARPSDRQLLLPVEDEDNQERDPEFTAAYLAHLQTRR